MSLPQGNKKEELQRACFRAVVAQSGASFYIPNYDCGADYVLTTPYVNQRGRTAPTAKMVFCQLKASQDCSIQNNAIAYELDAEAYNKFAELAGVLAILVLLHLPKNEEEWLTIDQTAMCIRNCCYWYEVPKEITLNNSTITVKIPLAQVFDPPAVHRLLDQSVRSFGDTGR